MVLKDDVKFANPILMPRVWCRSHKQIAIDDFVALIIIEAVVLLVVPTLGLFFQHGCH